MRHCNQTFITLIIDRYNLELDSYLVDSIVATWLQKYDRDWIIKAIVESIHRGRYKVRSVDSILISWHRIGKPAYKFTAEFEREILENLPKMPEQNGNGVIPITSSPAPEIPVTPPILLNFNSDDLNPEESAPFQHHNHSFSPILAHSIQSVPIVGDASNHSSVTLRSTQLTNIQNQKYFDLASVDATLNLTEFTTNRIVAQPANFQLFRTLKAIVEPKYPKIADTSTLDSSLSTTEAHLPSIANFQFSLKNASGE